MPVANLTIVEQVMRIYSSFGYRSFILSCGYLKEMIVDHFGRLNGTWDWDVRCEDTGDDADTGDRIYRLRHLLTEPFHATYCDGLGDVDLADVLASHQKSGDLATVTGVTLRSQYGLIDTDENDRVTGFREKPILPDFWINGGFFVFQPEVFERWSGHNLERDVLPELANQRVLHMYRHHGFWKSMDTNKEQQELNELWEPYSAQLPAPRLEQPV
jgi:glucose-1-phosphate cytidylyltransferase